MIRTSERIRSMYGEIRVPECRQYLGALTAALWAVLDPDLRQSPQPLTHILATSEALAFSVHRSMYFSQGAIRSAGLEAEFAFIVAHEIAHHALRHTSRADLESLSASDLAELEQEADALALGIVLRSGFDPRYALHAVARAELAWNPRHLRSQGLQSSRIANIEKMLQRSRILLPGIADSRGFQRFSERCSNRK